MAYYGVTGQQLTQGQRGQQIEKQGLNNLLQMLQTQGRIDPRLMANLQAQNARSTQQRQDSFMGRNARSGFGNSGLAAALHAGIGQAGANNASNIGYQDIADSYGRNQQNIGLMGQIVQQPNLGFANLQSGNYWNGQQLNQQKQASNMALFGSLLGAAGGAVGGCWVAEAIFGKDAEETHLARFYVNTLAPAEFKAAYLEDGKELASMVEADPTLRASLRPTFLSFADASASAIWG